LNINAGTSDIAYTMNNTTSGSGSALVSGATIEWSAIPNNTVTLIGGATTTLNLTNGDTVTFTEVSPTRTRATGGSNTVEFDNPSTQLVINMNDGNNYTLNFTDLAANFNPTNGIDINGNSGQDAVHITDLGDSFGHGTTGALEIDLAGGGSDAVTFQSTAPSLASATVSAETINVDVPSITTSGNQTYTGNIDVGVNTELDAANINVTGGINGAFNLTLDGVTDVSGTIGGTIADLTVETGTLTAGTIDIDGDLIAATAVSTDTGAITVDGNVDLESTLGSALGVTVLGTSELGGDVTAENGNATFTGAATLTDTVAINSSANDGNILFNSTIATGGNDLELNAGSGGNITLSDDLSGLGNMTVVDGAVQSYQGLELTTLDIQDATTGVTFNESTDMTTTVGVVSGGTVDVDAKMTAGGAVDIDAVATITIDGAIHPPTVTLESDTDIVVNAAVSADTLITVSGGTDGTGDVTISGTGSLTTADAGSDIQVTSGATTGAITLNGNVLAVNRVTLTSNGTGDITQGGGALTAANLQVTGVGTVTLEQAGNDVNTIAVDLNNGSISFTDFDEITVGTVATSGITTGNGGNGGVVTINATSGTITVDDAISTSPGTGGGVVITGAVTLNDTLTAGGGTITLNGNTAAASDIVIGADITSATVDFDALQDIIIRAKVESTTGSIDLSADSNGNGSGGVWVDEAAAPDAKLSSAAGVTLTGSDLITGHAGTQESVQIDADGTKNQIVAAGNITIGPRGNAPGNADVEIDGAVESTGASTTIAIEANEDVLFGSNGDVTRSNAAASGLIHVFADQATGSSTGGVVQMADGTVIDGGGGAIEIFADGTLTIGEITTTGLVNAVSLAANIADADAATGNDITANGLAISGETGVGTDADAIETTVNTLSGRTNSGDFHITNTGDLDLGVVDITTNFEALLLGQTEAIGVEIQDDADGKPNSGNDNITITASGELTVSPGPDADGDMGGVGNHDGGNITLAAEGNTIANDLDIDANITATGGTGSIRLYAGDRIEVDGSVTVSAESTGTVLLSAGSDFNDGTPIDGNVLGDVLMSSGSTVQSQAGDITILASRDVKLSVVNTDSDTSGGIGDVIVTADYAGPATGGAGDLYASNDDGAITDNLTGENANITGDELALRAGSGIGDGEAPDTNDLDTNVRVLAAVTEWGDIHVQNGRAAGLTINTFDGLSGVTITDAGVLPNSRFDHITIRSTSPLTVDAGDPVVNNDGGNITLAAEGVADTDNLTINANVTVKDGDAGLNSNGNINLLAGHSIATAASASLIVSADGGGQVVFSAGTNFNDGTMQNGHSTGDVTLGDRSQVATADGQIALLAPDDIALSIVNANSDSTGVDGSILIVADWSGIGGGIANGTGKISDNLTGEGANVIGGSVIMSAEGEAPTGIGDGAAAGNDIDTQLSNLSAETDLGDIIIDNAGELTIGDGSGNGVNITLIDRFSGAGNLTGTQNGAFTLSGITIKDSTPDDNSGNDHLLLRTSGTLAVDANNAVANNDSGNVLLEATGTASDAVLNARVSSTGGHVTIAADDDVDVNDVLTTGGDGTVYITAADQDATDLNGISLDATVTTENGDVLLSSADDITQNALITSTGGDVGLVATDAIEQTVDGDITTTTGDVLVEATASDWTMAGGATITAGGQQVLGISGGTITLGVISVTNATENHIALEAAASILDANGASVNIEEEASIAAGADTTLSLRAGSGSIGQADTGNLAPDTNDEALDLNVDTLAANAETGIYLRELADGGAIEVNQADAVAVTIDDVQQVFFNSTDDEADEGNSLIVLEDLTTDANGPIKLVAEAGTITVEGGADTAGVAAHGSGNALLEARGGTSDVIVNDTVTSGSGHITLDAEQNVDVNAAVTVGTGGDTVYVLSGADTDIDAAVTTDNGDILIEAGDDIRQTALVSSTAGDIGLIAAQTVTQEVDGDITTTSGDVLVEATASDWTMDGGATITAGGQQVLGISGGTITLGVISVTDADENHIALEAAASILDANGASVNIEEEASIAAGAATTLSLRAGSGSIGQADTANAADSNDKALDLNVDTVAANAQTGIYLREIADGGAIEVNQADAVAVTIDDVQQVFFNSTDDEADEGNSQIVLEDLTTDANGPIKLVAEAGTITVEGGITTPTSGVSAHGSGNVLLEARTAGDVIVNATVSSGSGHITLDADNDVDVNAAMTVSSGGGTVYVLSGVDTDIDAAVTTDTGDILIEAGDDIRQTALVSSTAGDIGLLAAQTVTQEVDGDITTTTGDVLIEATASDWTMDGGGHHHRWRTAGAGHLRRHDHPGRDFGHRRHGEPRRPGGRREYPGCQRGQREYPRDAGRRRHHLEPTGRQRLHRPGRYSEGAGYQRRGPGPERGYAGGQRRDRHLPAGDRRRRRHRSQPGRRRGGDDRRRAASVLQQHRRRGGRGQLADRAGRPDDRRQRPHQAGRRSGHDHRGGRCGGRRRLGQRQRQRAVGGPQHHR